MNKIDNSIDHHDPFGFFVRQGDFQRKCYYSEILWVEADRCYSDIYRKGKSRISVVHPMASVEQMLPKEWFMRIHRSYIVNLRFVDGFVGNSVCIGEKMLPISAPYKESLYAYFHFLDSLRRKK
ncbi:LytTR family DNA-binding domain-containing protein [Butyricimonas hominis]|uniref:LytR/AlgR family response regulator transcription factor n=1 Tax=Butyricimonas hominis TaxID=2763032 RepID=UPI0035125FE8